MSGGEKDDFEDLGRDQDIVADEGAALDSAEARIAYVKLPRFLRFAVTRTEAAACLVADCRELAPELIAEAARWADHPKHLGWHELAAAFDRAASVDDKPMLRGLADSVRLLSMTLRDIKEQPGDGHRVLAALNAGLREADIKNLASSEVLAFIERLLIGWCAILASDRERFVSATGWAHRHADQRGKTLTALARVATEEEVEQRYQRRKETEAATGSKTSEASPASSVPIIDDDHIVICPAIDTKANAKVRDACKGHEHAIGTALPLVPMPDLAIVRQELLAEFPYATVVIDRLLSPLIGRRHVHFPPIIIVGPPGAGKSRLARRFSECLGVGVWRTDAARSDGSTFGGTDRRWYTTEPAHPFLACSRSRIANPVILIDELEKAATRSDYGRLWDSLLGFMEPETARAYPDPCLQQDLDLSNVSFIATANSLLPLPSPLLDRCRTVEMPEPQADDFDALIPPLMTGLLAEQELDARWVEPLSVAERALLASHWRGGSVRRLRACLAVLMRARDSSRVLQ